ncbi:hypothetical protein RJ639_031590 [Escallonia herrerae]|uniref:Subtilisin-like protease fibronectin type-III domain-containing protein n=1 Tax=Escallonia herrerae TaxID=1293975 RepID=A0AA88WZP9_9ASTE|nr:hypothetical protein RJ639_031590 [Escallonia herrerae]
MEVVVTRTVTHVSEGASSYGVTVTNPKGAVVTVDPPKMYFLNKGQTQSYAVQILAEKVAVPLMNMVTELGKLSWTDGKHQVTSPVYSFQVGGSLVPTWKFSSRTIPAAHMSSAIN